MHDVVDGLDQQLLEFVSRLETACLFEVSQPGALERLAPARHAALQEPTAQQLVHVACAGCIVVGRLSATSRLSLASVCRVMETFALDQVEGLSTFPSVVGRSGVALAVRREQLLSRLLTCEAAASGSVQVTEEMGEMLARVRVLKQLVIGVVCALASALGTLARLQGWDARELTQIVRTAHDGVLAGEEAAHEETRTKR